MTTGDNFIPYQPDGPPPVSVRDQQKPLQWLPPNVSATPVQSPVKRGDLPVFTSTGVIPFAPARTAQGTGAERKKE
jgi:histone deacetylase HOS3